MKHEKCQCDTPTSSCPLYGFMKGRRWEVCQGVNVEDEKRDRLLDAWQIQQEGEPSVLRKAVNLAGAVVRHAIDGFSILPTEEANVRLAVCTSGCEFWDGNEENPRCLHEKCGCWLKEKVRWRSEDCPVKKWPLIMAMAGTGRCGGCGSRAVPERETPAGEGTQ